MGLDPTSLPLGRQTAYADQYDPALLVAVPRAQTRDFWPVGHPLPFSGEDSWTGYELSWLNSKGKPQIACAVLRYSALSPALVESKSLKLYLNSFNQTVFADAGTVAATIAGDLTQLAGSDVQVTLQPLDPPGALALRHWDALCIDALDIEVSRYDCDASLLGCDPDDLAEEALVSHLFRSLCPVTGQPDWASLRIHYRGPRLRHDGLLRYLCSYRQHGGFHEQCVERIFCDLYRECAPAWLTVEGRFTRRGGLDINPFRSSDPNASASGARQVRQ